MSAFTVVNQTQPGFDPSSIFTALFGGTTGITFDPATFAMVNGPDSVAFYDGSLGLGVGAGLLITSGTIPGTSNTAGYFGVSNNMPGDAMLNQVVNTVFATQSYDATTIGFSFTVDDPSITGVSFNIVFGSDEYPEWVNQFVDIAAIWVNGQDVAYFNNDTNAPLSVIGSNLSSNYFINNTGNLTTSSFGGVARPGVASLLPIEYDGVSAALTVFAPVHQGVNTLRIGIADTGDHIYDSGLFISNMRGTAIPVTGITRDIDGGGNNDLLQGTEDPEFLQGAGGDDDLRGGGGDDVLHGDAGDDFLAGDYGNDVLEGGLGIDVATYSGNAADYMITNNGDGTFTIADQRLGAPDGTDRLIGVEIAQFADIALDLESMTEVARHTAPDAVAPPAPTPVVLPVTTGPAASGPVLGNATEDGASVSLDALANLGGFDPAATLTITDAPLGVDGAEVEIEGPDEVGGHGLTGGHGKAGNGIIGAPDSHTGIDGAEDPSGEIEPVETEMENEAPVVGGGSYGFSALPPGVTFDAASHSFTLDPANTAYQYLAAGQQAAVTIHYGVTDGSTTIPASVVFTVTGTNDAPVVTGVVGPLGTHEDGGARGYSQMGLLRNVTDVDFNDKLTAIISEPLPEGVFTVDLPEGPGLMIDPANASFQSLAQGEALIVEVPYSVTDGTVTVADMAQFRVVGTNDAPVVSGPIAAATDEDGATISVSALANASDIDHNTVLTVTNGPGDGPVDSVNDLNETPPSLMPGAPFDATQLPDGITFDAATGAFVLDPTHAAFQSLGAGEVRTITIDYGVSDGIATTAAQAVFTVTGVNDAPVVSGPAEASATEDAGSSSISRAGLLAQTYDADIHDTLSIEVDNASLPAGVTYHHVPGYTTVSTVTYYGFTQIITVPTVDTLTIDTSDAAYQSLAEGETIDVVANYRVSDGLVTVPAQAVFHVTGTNDAPVVAAPVTAAAVEDSAPVTVSGLANASDVDHGAILSVVAAPPPASHETENFLNAAGVLEGAPPAPAPILPFDPATLPTGVSFDAASNSLVLDPANPVFQSLSEGQVRTIAVDYGVSDGTAATRATARFTVTGVNDAPVAGAAQSFAANEGDLAITINPLANVSDVDAKDVLRVVPGALPDGVILATIPGGYYQPDVVITRFNPNASSFQSLAAGEVASFDWNYQVTDGHVTIADSMSFTITGTNDAPAMTGLMTAIVNEDGAGATIDGLSKVVDVDHGSSITLVDVPLALPAGVTYDAATHSFSIDPTDVAYQALAQGEMQTVSVAYGVSDGMVTSAAHVDFTVIGTNDAPVVTGPTTGSPNEDGNVVTVKALGNASDVDGGHGSDGLMVTGVPATLPAGVTYDAANKCFSLDPTNAAYQSLSLGESAVVEIPYVVSDGYVDVPTSVIFTVSGRNDLPTVAGAVQGGTVTPQSAPVVLNMLATTTDVDHLDVLAVGKGGGSNPTATITSGAWKSPIAFSVSGNTLTVDPKQFATLAAGTSLGLAFNYIVTDGNQGVAVPASAALTIQGTYAGPSGVTFTPATASLAKAQSGGGINSKTPIATIAQLGGLVADSYSYSLGGVGAASFTLATASGTTSLQTGTSPAAGAAGGRLYALSVTATDTTAGISAPATPLNVVVGQGSGSGTINLAALPSMITAAPTFVYDLGGADQVNGAGMTGKLWINGGAGADTMTGGTGASTYLYGATTDSTPSAMDIITNFHSATDLIDLTGLGKALSVGALASGATSVGGSSVGWTTSGGNTFIYVNPTSNAQALGSAAMKIELVGTPTLAPANFAHV